KSEVIRLLVSLNGTILVGEDNDTIDAGFMIPSALGDRIWIDLNRNGLQDPGEPGLNGARVNLYRVINGNVESTPFRTEYTAANPANGEAGYYWFGNLAPGQYVVEFDISEITNLGGEYEYTFTKALDTNPTENSDAKHAVGSADSRVMRTDVITLGADQEDDTWDAGVMVYSALGGYAFDDMNYNDVQDLFQPLLGTKVYLYRVINGVREDKPIRETTVDSNGRYFFDLLEEGQYQVYFEFPEDYYVVSAHQGGDDTLDSDVELEISPDLRSGFTPVINLPINAIDTTWDGGAYKLGTIGDFVWYDTNKNGIQDAGEKGVPDIGVIIQRRTDGGLWEFYARTTTNEDGYYYFEGLKSGPYSGYSYRVIFELDPLVRLTLPGEGDDIALDSDAIPYYIDGFGYATRTIELGYGLVDLTWDAGIVMADGNASIGDFVWHDLNKNGLQDEDEPGIAGILVVLEMSLSGDIENEKDWIEVASTETNRLGYYLFDGLAAGNYRVKFQIPDIYTVTRANEGNDMSRDSDATVKLANNWYASRAFYLPEGKYDPTWDAGVYLASGSSSRTGDGTNMWLWIGMIAIAGVTIVALMYTRKRRNGQKKA
ncbi:hypothetical protein LJB83_02700, partial [Clostridia bacterium OttesenSCG-928-F22]|nr:hypothetical protein [Clostridia bacterium OttesenSCG-928-F22]